MILPTAESRGNYTYLEDFSERIDELCSSLNGVDEQKSDPAQPATLARSESNASTAEETDHVLPANEFLRADEVEKIRELGAVSYKQSARLRRLLSAASSDVFLGMLMGFFIFLVLLANPMGCVYPSRAMSLFFDSKGWCKDGNVWCDSYWHVPSLTYQYHFPEEALNMFKDASGISLLSFVLKLVVCMLIGALTQASIHATCVGVKEAGLPMKIMGDILLGWARSGYATPSQLQAWSLARRSLLHNEVAFLLDRFENTMVGYILTCLVASMHQVLIVLLWDGVPTALNAFVFSWIALGALTTMKAAMACHWAQLEHSGQLRLIQEHLVARRGRNRELTCRLIEQMLEALKISDFQSKLMYVPLNPFVMKALMGYFVSAIMVVVGKIVLDARSA
jgi:hypothetical protein